MPDYTMRQLRLPFVTGLRKQLQRDPESGLTLKSLFAKEDILELTDPRMCHRCGIFHKLWRTREHCEYCRAELEGKHLMPMIESRGVSSNAGFAQVESQSLAQTLRRINSRSTTQLLQSFATRPDGIGAVLYGLPGLARRMGLE